jgi:hypothetical protein
VQLGIVARSMRDRDRAFSILLCSFEVPVLLPADANRAAGKQRTIINNIAMTRSGPRAITLAGEWK